MMYDTSSQSITTHSTLGKEGDYRPLAIRITQDDGSQVEYSFGCGLNFRDLLSILGLYILFYTALVGFCAILLHGAMATRDTDTLMWAFFVVGLVFGGIVGLFLMLGKSKRANTESEDDLAIHEEMNP